MSTQTPASVEALVQKARELYPSSIIKIEYWGSGDSWNDDQYHVNDEYISDPDATLAELARELMGCGGADFSNEGGGGTITVDTKNLICRRLEYNNISQQVYEPEETWQVW